MKTWSITLCVAVLAFAGCAAEDGGDGLRGRPKDGSESKDGVRDGSDAPPGTLACTKTGRSYPNFDGSTLEAGRVVGTLGGERDRMKPYTALKADLGRVLGTNVALPKGAFAEEPANATPFEQHYTDNDGKPSKVSTFHTDATSSALELYTVVETAQPACAAYVTANPSADCTTMARAFWSRVPTPLEIDACNEAAKNGKVWGCTALVTSANFLAY